MKDMGQRKYVRHADVTVGVQCLWNVITAYIVLGALCFHFYLRSAQAQVLWMFLKCKFKLKYKSQRSASTLT